MAESRKHPVLRMGVALLLAALLLPACSSSGPAKNDPTRDASARSAEFAPVGGGNDVPAWERRAQANAGRPQPQRAGTPEPTRPLPEPVADRPTPTGAQIRIEWEALAVERERCANPRFRRQRTRGTLTMQKVVVVSESHQDAVKSRYGAAIRGDKGVAVGMQSDKDMEMFLKGLEQRGFWRLARPTASVQHLFDDESARGRITVERGGESHTLLSMRGQGLNPATKGIPPLYSELKQTIIAFRNQTPTLTVIDMGRDPMSR